MDKNNNRLTIEEIEEMKYLELERFCIINENNDKPFRSKLNAYRSKQISIDRTK